MSGTSVVVVTGASGFIGAHIVRECLERGFTVNACVRNKDDPKNKFLLDMARDIGKGSIRLFSADLVTEGAYDEAVSNADAVIHAAAQVDPGVIKDPWTDMVRPSTEGARNILRSVNKFKVKHYVHTSSMAAVGSAPGRQSTEADWSTVPIEEIPYNFAKTEAERLVWRETEGKPYTVSCINPSMVFGPCLAKPHAKASPYVFRQALYGNNQPNQPYSVVDVREVATAHVEAMLRPEAHGKRFILDADEPSIAVNDLIQKCREMFPQVRFDDAPGSKGWNQAWGKQPKRSGLDNSRSKQVLGITYRPMDATIRDTVQSLLDGKFVPIRPVSKL
mmetsp:Transcript_41367/g.95843  ORF Transcript_41367/g.95843 Transcript_41367/m.95843 type:complete len:333 (-) Transcript_41367:188-1186(-)|eukprot:CAMPEP_0171093812 /NCGR_PEP_ID=MMETSP0766_2-20121228/39292_1 /TAXON_ID=439317 /ORGANISM="Gambierdiscus australes, Strain CAWD 149" /LENGTH=332 /DNA_ID=CAMNT_0011552305 /DNA_START=76 /DNA_END=1074 /DNA_ORIENTATION=-